MPNGTRARDCRGRRNKVRLTVAMAEGYHKYETCENFGIPTDVISYYIDHQDGFPTHFSTMICEWPFDTVIFLFSLHILLDVFVCLIFQTFGAPHL